MGRGCRTVAVCLSECAGVGLVGNWLYPQRRIKNGKTPNKNLTQEQAKKLEALGLH
ncbi:MAG: helicase associated domain-containing protein [Ruthenibacterium sp.]